MTKSFIIIITAWLLSTVMDAIDVKMNWNEYAQLMKDNAIKDIQFFIDEGVEKLQTITNVSQAQ